MFINFESIDNFSSRHIGPDPLELKAMLNEIGVDSLDQLISETIPESIRLKQPINLPESQSENQFTRELKTFADKNKIFRTYIGMGYYDCMIPAVIQRNILENPGWYTSYTPYQAEISQGRLEALLNFQTMVSSLTGMEVANASLLDEGTAAAEAMAMFQRLRDRKSQANTFFVSEKCFPQTIDIIKTRAIPLGISLLVGDIENIEFDDIFGILVQYPCEDGSITDYREFIKKAHSKGVLVAVATDLLSLTLLSPPGELDADAVLGSSQRLGVPLGYGGPHAAFFATKDEYKRQIPGRIIGISVDSNGNKAYRMALQTREQHIRRDKANSNICTAQALLANMASSYAVYHGPKGLKEISERVHNLAQILEIELTKLGFEQVNKYYFDTLKISLSEDKISQLRKIAEESRINFRFSDNGFIGISLDETTLKEDINNILAVFAKLNGSDFSKA